MEKEHLLTEESINRRTALFNQYVVPHVNLVYKLCIQYSFFKEEIQDNYLEVLINFYRYIDTYDPSRSIQTWLHIVTKRYIMDLNEKQSLFRRNDDVDVNGLIDTTYEMDDVSSHFMHIDNYHQYYSDDVMDALDTLKPIYKDALLLQQAGYKLEEIMEIAYKEGTLKHKNIETIKSRLFLAKQHLRRQLTRDGEKREVE